VLPIQVKMVFAELGNILRDTSYGMLRKALKAITKLYDKVDFKETAVDPNHEASIFAKGRTGRSY
jgi:hypothetical protein